MVMELLQPDSRPQSDCLWRFKAVLMATNAGHFSHELGSSPTIFVAFLFQNFMFLLRRREDISSCFCGNQNQTFCAES